MTKLNFDRDGLLIEKNIFSPKEIESLKKEILIINESHRKNKGDWFHILEASSKSSFIDTLIRHEKIVKLVSALVGNDFELQHSKIASKPSEDDESIVNWHQDFAFFPHSNTSLVAVTIAVSDLNEENGAVQYILGSHKDGLKSHSKDGFFSEQCTDHHYLDSHGRPIYTAKMRSGDVSVHHCLTLHRSGINKSKESRDMVVFQYRSSDSYQFADDIWVDTGKQISGTNKNVVRCEPQSIELPKTKRYPNYFGNSYNQSGKNP